jgi:hypothetical protein
MTHVCPVCGYDRLRRPPADFLICASCGTEFGLDDDDRSVEELRHDWLAAGAPWWSTTTPPPAGWDPIVQVMRVSQPFRSPSGGSSAAVHLLGRGQAFDLVASDATRVGQGSWYRAPVSAGASEPATDVAA